MRLYHAAPVILVVFALVFSSCLVKRNISRELTSYSLNVLERDRSDYHGFYAFVLYDMDKGEYVVNTRGDKLFLPASNTKLFTFFTSLNILGDSLPVLEYDIDGDTLYFRGTGNPLALNPVFDDNYYARDFLRSHDKIFVFCNDNYYDKRFGSGWAWDDYIYDFQCEKNSFPLYGNKLTLSFEGDTVKMTPEHYFNVHFTADSNRYYREEFSNDFWIGKFKNGTKLQIPFLTGQNNVIRMLSRELGDTVLAGGVAECSARSFETYKIPFPDTVYMRLLKNSDNFIAEQLMLMCASELFDTLSTAKAIDYAKVNFFPWLENNSRWVDGSGLSRYNLFSPVQIVKVLQQIYQKEGWERIKRLFPSPGEGTLRKQNTGIPASAVFAKSGSMSNNYNLSGYIRTAKGNNFIFSFMHNHFLHGSTEVKKSIEKILQYIYWHY